MKTSLVVIALAALAATSAAQAQDYPARPVTIVVPQAPAAASDLIARTVGERLQAQWGQTVVVDNRPGAGGNVGAGFVARAPADGYTLMIGTDAMMTSNVHLYRSMPFDPLKDFAPITNVGANIICLAVNAQLPVNSVPELIAYAKANPGKLQYGSSGIASPHHLAGELLAQKAGIKLVHVPYRGGGLAVNDLLGGHINAAFLSLSAAVPHLATGKIRILAVVEKSRYAAMPNVPTVAETIPGYEMSSWLAFFAPAATPAAAGRAAERHADEDHHHGRGKGEVRDHGARGRAEHAGRAHREDQGGARGARRAGKGRRHSARMNML